MSTRITALACASVLLVACGEEDQDERITQLEADFASMQSSTNERLTELETTVTDLETALTELETAQASTDMNVAANTTSIDDLETLTEPMTREDVDGVDSIVFSGINVHVRNGLGQTECDDGTNYPICNGAGNLIVGYNELRSSGGNDRSGSHYFVAGKENSYLSFGSIILGERNRADAPYSSILGGSLHYTAETATHSSILGGYGNSTYGEYATVSGGENNRANGESSSISGGRTNHADGEYSFIAGGRENTATGPSSTVTGGRENTASGEFSTVSGGYQRSTGTTAPANQYDWVAGSLFEDE